MLDIGGGLPIRYVDAAAYASFLAAQDGGHYRHGKVPASFYPYGGPMDASTWLAHLLASPCADGLDVAACLRGADLTLAIEPGRSLVDQAAISVFRVTRTKPLAPGRCVVLVEGSSFSACETWFSSEFLVDPLHVPAACPQPQGAPPATCHAYIAGHSCLDDDVLTHRWIHFARTPQRGDLLVYANTAGYQMDLLENEFHRHPMPRRIAVTRTAAGGMAFSPDDNRTE
jgi:diaminopimelate decarboxylase